MSLILENLTNETIAIISSSPRPGPCSHPRSRNPTAAAMANHSTDIAISECRALSVIGRCLVVMVDVDGEGYDDLSKWYCSGANMKGQDGVELREARRRRGIVGARTN